MSTPSTQPGDLLLTVPAVSACLHVPRGARKPRPAEVTLDLPLRIRRAARDDFTVAAWLVSASGRDRSAILVDARGRHYAPVSLRLGAYLTPDAFLRTLNDPVRAIRLDLPGIGARVGSRTPEGLGAREIVDDGRIAATARAQVVADDLLAIGEAMHRQVDPPCRLVRFDCFDGRHRFAVDPHVALGMDGHPVYLRLAPGEDAAPYEAAMTRAGRTANKPAGRGLVPGETPPAFGHDALLADVLAGVPLAAYEPILLRQGSPAIRAQADLGRALQTGGQSRDRTALILDRLAGIHETGRTRAALALYAERLGRLA